MQSLVEAGPLVIEVDDEAVGTGLDVLGEPFGNPAGRAGDRMPAALVDPRARLGLEVDADANDDAAVGPASTELGGHAPQLVRRERDRVPDACERSAPER